MPLDPALEKIRKEMERSPEYRASVERAAQTMFEASIAAQAAEAGVSPEAWTRAASKATLDQARNLADRAAESLIRDFTTAELNSIGEKIARAIEEGKRPRDIAKTLDEVKKLDKNRAAQYEKIQKYLEESDLTDKQLKDRLDREYNKLLRERKRDIAANEGNEAAGEGRYSNATGRGYKWKSWVTTQDERVCPICTGNEAEGIIPINQVFGASGTLHQPAHPRCRCSVNYLPDNPRALAVEERANKRRQDLAAKAKDEK